MIIETKYIFEHIKNRNFQVFGSDTWVLLNTVIFDQQKKVYKSMSLKFSQEFTRGFSHFFVKAQRLHIDSRSQADKKPLEFYIFAKVNGNDYRLSRWINQTVPLRFKFKKTKYKNCYLYIKVPKSFVGIRYENKNIRSFLLLKKQINIDGGFARRLGIFASDGYKTSSLGIGNTDLFMVKELRNLFLDLGIIRERLRIVQKKHMKKEHRKCYIMHYNNIILRNFVNKLHLKFLNDLSRDFKGNKKLAAAYIQGLHAGDGSCSKRFIHFTSYKGDPALRFLKENSKSLELNIGYIDSRQKNYEVLLFNNLVTYLNFYKKYIWHPKKLSKARNFLKDRSLYILFHRSFLNKLSSEKPIYLSNLFKTEQRTIYRYLSGETYIPFNKILGYCQRTRVSPRSLMHCIRELKTTKEKFIDNEARNIYSDFLKINEVCNNEAFNLNKGFN